MADLSEQLRGLLADPSALEKITAIAGALSSGGTAPKQTPVSEAAWAPKPVTLPPVPQKRDPREELLRALRPFVRPEKQAGLDEILRMMAIANLVLPLLRGKGGNGVVQS